MRVFRGVEMWCRRQAAAAILPLLLAGWMTGESSEALPTFGISATTTRRPPGPVTPPARECSRQSDCSGITGTSCVRTSLDSSTRCFCGDNQPPVNGRCSAQYRGLRHVCTDASECQEGLICATPNVTETAGRPAWATAQDKQTFCLCDTENGYVEKELYCSDAEILKTSLFAILVVTALKKILD